jgi:drug/metabolite transporter (DMT)-like permease
MNGLLPERKTRLDSLAISLLLGCCLLWGMQQVLIKVTLSEMPPVFQAWMRMLGAALLLLIWCRLRGIVWWHKDGTLRAGLLAGLLFAAEFVCIYVGMQYTGSSRLTVFLYTSPFWVALLVPLWARSERLHAGQWAGLALAFCAVVFALREGLMQAGGPTLAGDLFGLAAGLFWGLTTVVIRSSSLTQVRAEKLLLYQVGVSAALLPCLSLALGETWRWDYSAWAWGAAAAQASLGGFFSFLIWMWLLGRYPVTRVSSFSFFTPLFTLLFGALWLGEAVTSGVVLAIAAVAVGMVLMNRPARAAR